MNRTDLDELIRAVRPVEEPRAADRERVRAGLERRIAAHAPEPELPPLDGTEVWSSKWALTLGAVAGVAGVVALALWFGGAAPDGAEEPLPAPVVAAPIPASSPVPATATEAVEAPPPRTAPAAPVVAQVPRVADKASRVDRATHRVESRTTVTSPSLNLAAESRGLGEVQAALRDGMPARALELLSVQEREFAGGVLVEERAAARAMALCATARSAAGRSAADEFARRYPSSALGARVRQACAEDSPGKAAGEP